MVGANGASRGEVDFRFPHLKPTFKLRDSLPAAEIDIKLVMHIISMEFMQCVPSDGRNAI
jgi:hypothetical protein